MIKFTQFDLFKKNCTESTFILEMCKIHGIVLDFIGELPAMSPIVFLRFQITAHGTGGGLVALVVLTHSFH